MNEQNIELKEHNLNVDKSIEEILLQLAQAIQSKNDKITDLKLRANYIEAKSNELERYLSKDTIIICRLVTKTTHSMMSFYS